MINLREEIEKVLIEYKSKIIGIDYMKFDEIVDKRKYELSLDDQATDQILQVFEEMLPEEKSVNRFNLSPHPDIMNDFEVERKGFNSCRAQIRERIEK